jgi:hypothetical protein
MTQPVPSQPGPDPGRADDRYDEQKERMEPAGGPGTATSLDARESAPVAQSAALSGERASTVDAGDTIEAGDTIDAGNTVREQPSRAPSDGRLPPGASVDDPVAALWGADLVERFRLQWADLQLRFVDDPRSATEQAARLVDEAVQALTNRLTGQKQALDGWQSADRDDTEVLRVALRRYREFLDRLLGL